MKHLIFTFFFGTQIYAQSFEPGLWKSKESLELNGVPLSPSSGEDCITAKEAKDAKATIEKELKQQGCSVVKWSVKNQKLDAAIKCDNDEMEAVGKLKGKFSRKSYELVGEAEGTIKKILPAVAVLRLSGEWVKSCPK